MTYTSDEGIEILKIYFSDDDFKAALDDPARRVFDQSSWTKWNQRYGRTPIPPLPKRRIPGVDRKSTRLNSSHVEISYAVFCLKKKTYNKREPHVVALCDTPTIHPSGQPHALRLSRE